MRFLYNELKNKIRLLPVRDQERIKAAIVSSDFPDIEVKKFKEWKEKGIIYWKNFRLYYFISMVIMAGTLMGFYVKTGFNWGMLTIAFLWAGIRLSYLTEGIILLVAAILNIF